MSNLDIFQYCALFGLIFGHLAAAPKKCKNGTLLVASRKTCVKLVTQKLAYVAAKKKCKALGGKILNSPDVIYLHDVREVINALAIQNQLKDAWIGMQANTETGSVDLLDGTDCTLYYSPPSIRIFNGNRTKKFKDNTDPCLAKYLPADSCPHWGTGTACYIKPIKNLSPNPGADFKLLQQYVRAHIHAIHHEDPDCVQQLNKDFDLAKKVKYDKAKPTIALSMDMLTSLDDDVPHTSFTRATVKLPVVCQFPAK